MTLVAVTGANGFIGRHASGGLLARGYRVRVLVRRSCDDWHAGIEERVLPELFDAEALTHALRGADAVVHLAGRAHVIARAAAANATEFEGVNVAGTAAVLDAAIRARASAFVHLSSVAAADATGVTSTSPYGRTKLESEQLVRERGRSGGIRTVILRPPMVYGPGMKGNPLRLFRLIDRGVPLPFGAIHNSRSMLYVGNLVEAILAVLATPAIDGEPLVVTDGEDLSTPEFIRRAARALQRRAGLLPVPPALLRTAGRLGDHLPEWLPWPLTSSTVRGLIGTLVVDDAELRRRTPYRPVFSVDEGLRLTAAWYRASVSRGLR